MRALLILTLLMTSVLHAQDDFDSQIKALEKSRDDALFKWRTEHRYSKLPNDEYVKFYTETWSKYGEDEAKIYEVACKLSKDKCLSDSQKREKVSEIRVVTGLIKAKNEWARAGKSETEVKKAEEDFKKCARDQKDCEKIPEGDRRIATQGPSTAPSSSRTPTPSSGARSTTTPATATRSTPTPGTGGEVSVGPASDGPKPGDAKPGDRKPGDRKPEDGKPEDRKPEDRKPETSSSLEEDVKAKELKLEEELKASEDEFTKTHEGWKRKEMTPEVKDFLIKQETDRLEKTLTMMKELCSKYKDNKDVCLDDENIKKLKEESLGAQCLVERKFASPKLKEKIETDHRTDWDALTTPKSCKALLEKDKKPAEPEQKPESVIEENDDEKSPRNYKAETCKWVRDLPRKVVNGPGCGPKSRSRICTGYVVCEQKQGGGKFIRMSSCRSDMCGSSDADAVRCTKDMHYFSERPATENKLFMSQRLKKILSGSGASEQ